jgi:hypothetical protein
VMHVSHMLHVQHVCHERLLTRTAARTPGRRPGGGAAVAVPVPVPVPRLTAAHHRGSPAGTRPSGSTAAHQAALADILAHRGAHPCVRGGNLSTRAQGGRTSTIAAGQSRGSGPQLSGRRAGAIRPIHRQARRRTRERQGGARGGRLPHPYRNHSSAPTNIRRLPRSYRAHAQRVRGTVLATRAASRNSGQAASRRAARDRS